MTVFGEISRAAAISLLVSPSATSATIRRSCGVKNAVEATLEAGAGAVSIGWSDHQATVEVVVRDEGPGLSSTTNLFVPFYTTKPNGSGIGLVLCRQVAEAHNGFLTLANRTDRVGSEARLTLPRQQID